MQMYQIWEEELIYRSLKKLYGEQGDQMYGGDKKNTIWICCCCDLYSNQELINHLFISSSLLHCERKGRVQLVFL